MAFFQAVNAALIKRPETDARPEEELNLAVRQIISRAVACPRASWTSSRQPVLRSRIFHILSDDFLAEVRGMPYRNLAVEMLQKLLAG